MNKILINDQIISGKSINQVELNVNSSKITIKDLIKSRITKEVSLYNEKNDYYGLVFPQVNENTSSKSSKVTKVDLAKQIYVALNGFLKHQYFILVGDTQVDTLEEEIHLNKINDIQFLKLTPLIGG